MSLKFEDCLDCKFKPRKNQPHVGICSRCQSGEMFEDDNQEIRSLNPDRDFIFMREAPPEWFNEQD